MKKYTLLGHIFELEPRAHDYLASYVTRIDTYAKNNNITPDILEDINYNIIEKLYKAPTPITQEFVMNIAETIGEPEAIFENKTDTIQGEIQPKNLIERWLGKDKPMVRGVGYWISKSLNIPVSIIRLVLLGSVFLYGTSLWIYPLLALFVPFQDKKSTTGQTGNIFFEIIRVLIWLGIIFFLASALFGGVLGMTVFSFIPTLSNQSLQAMVPSFIYPLVILSLVSGAILIIGALGALLKKSRVSKTLVLIASAIIVGSIVTVGVTGLSTFNTYNSHEEKIDKHIIATGDIIGESIVINLTNTGKSTTSNFLPRVFGSELGEKGMFQDLNLLTSDDNQFRVEVIDTTNIGDSSDEDNILSKRTDVITNFSGDTLDITIPNNIFSQKVPFSFAQRTINIYVPKDKKIIYNNTSELRYSTPDSWTESKQGKEFMFTCTDKLSFVYHTASESWRCAQTTQSEVNIDTNTISDPDGSTPEDYSDGAIERMFLGLTMQQAQVIAQTQDLTLRIVEQDDIELPVTDDYRPGRLNLEINNGVITDLEIE